MTNRRSKLTASLAILGAHLTCLEAFAPSNQRASTHHELQSTILAASPAFQRSESDGRLRMSTTKSKPPTGAFGIHEDIAHPPQGVKRSEALSAVSITAPSDYDVQETMFSRTEFPSVDTSFWQENIWPVLSGALLITGNTFGAGSLVLPELVKGPGLATSTGIFVAAYLMNLLSALVIAEVAIEQKEAAGPLGDVPSSFKEFVQENLKSPALANAISAISFSVNSLVFAFGFSRVGVLANQALGMDPNMASIAWAGIFAAIFATQSQKKVSDAASVVVPILFASFGSLLLPGLAAVSDPLSVWMTEGTATDMPASVMSIAPIIFMSMVFQNIVPTIAKNQDYDRTKTISTLVLGSSIPLFMYLAWCYACLGGGIDLANVGLEAGPMVTTFSLATLAGSSIGCGISCASELDLFVQATMQGDKKDESLTTSTAGEEEQRFSLTTVLATVGLPLSIALTFGQGGDLTGALDLAGGIGSPILYGTIPVMMAWQQRRQKALASPQTKTLVPNASLGFLGLISTGMFGNEMVSQISDAFAMAVP